MSYLKAKRIANYTNLPMCTGKTNVEHNHHVSGNLDISGDLSVHGDLFVDGNEYLGGNIDISGNEILAGDLHVSGNGHFDGNIDVSGNEYIIGDIHVTRHGYFGGNLDISGNEHIVGNLDVSGNQTVSGNMRIYGNEALTGNLDVSGNITTTADVHARNVYATGNYYLNNYVLIPAGTIIQSAAINIPTGWFECNGKSILTTFYTELFAAIGYTYGGSGTGFNLPDLRGRTSIGAGQGIGLTNRPLASTGGEENHTLSVSEMPRHNHDITDPGHTHTWNNGLERDDSENGGSYDEYTRIGGSVTGVIANATTGISINNTGGGEAHNNMQPYIVLRYLIKY